MNAVHPAISRPLTEVQRIALPGRPVFSNDFARALERPDSAAPDWIDFYTRMDPTPLPELKAVAVSAELARFLHIEPTDLRLPEWQAVLAGSAVAEGADPLAAVYSGHQFGVYVPQLGDGRALLLGGVQAADGNTWEIQLKGAGRTPYSRMGDGRAVLRSSIREFLCSEAMHALGIPTTRALSIVGSTQPVVRETVETAAVVARVSRSFIRFGSFEFFSRTGRHDQLKRLADYTIDTFYPQCRAQPDPYLAFVREVAERTARLVARWQAVGFCHGVMNSDNMSILGLTIDYGPFGFLDAFDRDHICNHSDEGGRYAYDMQPKVAHWNLYCLGQALMPLVSDGNSEAVDAMRAALDAYLPEFDRAYAAEMQAKLGLLTPQPDDGALVEHLLELLHGQMIDWTNFWRGLSSEQWTRVRDLFVDRNSFDAWGRDYAARIAIDNSDDAGRSVRMKATNPRIVLRNHLAETAIRKARGDDAAADFTEVDRLLQALSQPFDDDPQFNDYAESQPSWASQIQVSCSS